MLKIGTEIEIEIEKIVSGGEGLGYYDDFAVFVPMSVPADKLAIKIISVKKNYARGLIQKIVKASPERVEDTKKISFEDFGGCDFGMLKYEAQLKYKKLIVEDVMSKIGKNKDITVLDTKGSEKQKHYRNKIIEPFSKNGKEIITGFFKKRSHEVFEVEENALNSELGNRIIDEVKILINREKFSVYDEKTHRGELRHIMVRTNSKDEAMVVLIVNSFEIKKYKNLLKELKEKIPQIKSTYISQSTKRTNVIFGEKEYLVEEDAPLYEEIEGIKFIISPRSFFQINLPQAKKLYKLAINKLENIEDKVLVDAYSGTGTIGMILSKRAKYVYGIEISSDAVEDAKKTAIKNGIENIEFICGKTDEELPKLLEGERKPSAIVFDPPRKGLEEKSLINVAKSGINEIVYISCNPATFARDSEILGRLGYKIDEVQPVDMFPNTSHIEVVGRFYRDEL